MKLTYKLIVISIILIFAIFLFYPLKYNELRTEWTNCEKNKSCEIMIYLESPSYGSPNFLNMLRKVTSPFEFKYMDLFLEPIENDKENCSVVYVQNADYNLVRENIKLEDKKNISVGKKEKIGSFKSDKNYTIISYNITYEFDFSQTTENGSCSFIVPPLDTKAYSKIAFWDAIGNILIFSFFWIGFILIILEIIKK